MNYFFEDTDNGSLYTGFKAPNVTTSIAYTLPVADGSSGQHLQTAGNGTVTWETPSGGGGGGGITMGKAIAAAIVFG